MAKQRKKVKVQHPVKGMKKTSKHRDEKRKKALEFRKFTPNPYVRLEYIDITPYLKGRKLPKKFNDTVDTYIAKLNYDDEGETQPVSAFSADNSDKTFKGRRNPVRHVRKGHLIDKSQHTKPKKRVLFSEDVVVYRIKEYDKCPICLKLFHGKSLKAHKKEFHADIYFRRRTRSFYRNRNCYICNKCGKVVMKKMKLIKHVHLHK